MILNGRLLKVNAETPLSFTARRSSFRPGCFCCTEKDHVERVPEWLRLGHHGTLEAIRSTTECLHKSKVFFETRLQLLGQ